MDTIFVSIACYRDADVINTLDNLFKTAKYPSRVIAGVCVQFNSNEDAGLYYGLIGIKNASPLSDNIKVMAFSHKESKGVCWARSTIQQNLYDGEDYYFQVDSHSRFINNWDEVLVDQIKRRKGKNNKLIISTYPHTFEDYSEYKTGTFVDSIIKISPDGFSGPVLKQTSEALNISDKFAYKVPFVTGGFLFAEGQFVHEVPYDPVLYFEGEESALSIRAYTCGWDVYNPCRAVVFHDYNRIGNRHWDHHSDWTELDETSKNRYASIISGEVTSLYGLGNKRSLDSWCEFIGYDMKTYKPVEQLFITQTLFA